MKESLVYIYIGLLIVIIYLSCAISDVRIDKDLGETITDGEDDASGDHLMDTIIIDNDIERDSTNQKSQNKDHPDLYEGDILLDQEDTDVVYKHISIEVKRSTIPFKRKIWIHRIVPYEINHPGTTYSNAGEVKSKLYSVFDTITAKTDGCLTFRPRISTDQQWIRIFKGIGCYSGIGRKFWGNVATDISLGSGCINEGIIKHEVLHALGFFHEQNRPERNSYVKILWHNIRAGAEDQFQRHPTYETDDHGVSYDYNSIMHYSKTSFTANGKPTMEAKDDPNRKLGSSKFSEGDILKIRSLYQCDVASSNGWSGWSSWTPCSPNRYGKCASTRQRFCISKDALACPQADVYGVQDENKECSERSSCEETFDGFWSSWETWTSCSESCDFGMKRRERKCESPIPSGGGKPCVGSSKQNDKCRLQKCFDGYYDTNFDSTLENWRRISIGGANWIMGIYDQFKSSKSVAIEDHTTGKGFYAFLTSKSSNDAIARLVSNIVDGRSSFQYCLSLYFILNGDNEKMYLDVYLKTKATAKYFNVWSRRGHQSKHWLPMSVSLPSLNEPYEVIIEGKNPGASNSFLAIDDIQFDRGNCLSGTEVCIDVYKDSCKSWAMIGECYRNRFWMINQCCQSCTELGGCLDENSKCSSWAEQGECDKNPSWMWVNCCAACKGCLDSTSFCSVWAENGECIKNKIWMESNCKESCQMCLKY